jgi:ACS family allantoate permease-like MFS transporter
MSVEKNEHGIEQQQPVPEAVSVHDVAVLKTKGEAAAAFLGEHQEQWANYDAEEAKRVLRKIDWRVMPLVVGTITIAAVDVGFQRRNDTAFDQTAEN